MPEPEVKDSILLSTKKLLQISPEDDAFDLDIVTQINTAFSILFQAGVGPLEGYQIEDSSNLWSEFIGEKTYINDVKTYVQKKCQLYFDPPALSFVITSIEKQLDELIWRLNVADDPFEIVPATP